jgi:hypothetical protein
MPAAVATLVAQLSPEVMAADLLSCHRMEASPWGQKQASIWPVAGWLMEMILQGPNCT